MSTAAPRILVCDDEKNMRNLLLDLFAEEGWQALGAENGPQALRLLGDAKAPPIPVMLLDLSMPGMDGFHVLDEIRRLGIETSVVVITAFGTVDMAVRAMQAGASDFVVKPFDNARIVSTVRRVLETRDLMKQVELSHPMFVGADQTPMPIIGEDERLKGIFRIVRKIADLSTAVLITGESGTGKELVAQAIHYNGSRRNRPIVAVNCGALPEALLESEFFGHERGAFTGAHALQRGKFELANGGTLFLDEIGEMPLNLQVKLLRVLQDGTFTRVGGEKEIKVDVRIIAATNRELAREVAGRTFREDLYYRLNVLPIHLPPLRERKGDIPQLVRYFIDRFCKRHNLPGLAIRQEHLEKLCTYSWPGNIRELQNVIEKAVILQDIDLLQSPGSSDLVPRPDLTVTPAPAAAAAAAPAPTPQADGDSALVDLGEDGAIRDLSEVAADAQRAALIRALKLCGGNKAEAAKRLGVSYRTLFNRINELGITISTNVE